jgi:hypothetical protein
MFQNTGYFPQTPYSPTVTLPPLPLSAVVLFLEKYVIVCFTSPLKLRSAQIITQVARKQVNEYKFYIDSA